MLVTIRPPRKVRGYRIWYGPTPAHPDTERVQGLTYGKGQFDVVINVSDSPDWTPKPKGVQVHWLPVQERGAWPLAAIHAVDRLLERYHRTRQRVYIHCHAGCNRSPTLVALWLMARGLTLSQAASAVKSRGLHIGLRAGNFSRATIAFLRVAHKVLPTYSTDGVMGSLRCVNKNAYLTLTRQPRQCPT